MGISRRLTSRIEEQNDHLGWYIEIYNLDDPTKVRVELTLTDTEAPFGAKEHQVWSMVEATQEALDAEIRELKRCILAQVTEEFTALQKTLNELKEVLE